MTAAGYVYAISSGDAVKIGFAKDPVQRLSELNVGSPTTHRLLGMVPATKLQEAELHGLLGKYRIRGEWFRDEGAVSAFISMLPRPRPHPCETPAEALGAAIERAGSTKALASAIGVTPQALSQWKRVPARRAHGVAQATGVALHELRPDLWPPPASV